MKVFYSWQSDRPQAVCKIFIREAIEEALKRVRTDLGLEEVDRPEVDHDTKNKIGWVEITNEILRKIEACATFVCDVTPVAKADHSGKEIPNPNVMMELGYALKAVGPERIVLIVNTAYGARKPESLPFNMRHRSAPASYRLKKDATEEEFAQAREELVAQLVDWLGNCLKNALGDKTVLEDRWKVSDASDLAVWFPKGTAITHQGYFGKGSLTIALEDGARSYVRLLPSGWRTGPPPRESVHRGGNNLSLLALGRQQSGDGGLSKDGVLAYTVLPKPTSPPTTPSLAQYFQQTGEIWGVDVDAVTESGGTRYLSVGYTLGQWAWFMSRSVAIQHRHGARVPILVRLGVVGLDGTKFSGFEHPANIDDSFEYRDTLSDFSIEERKRVLHGAYNKLRHAYGLDPAPLETVSSMVDGLLIEIKDQ